VPQPLAGNGVSATDHAPYSPYLAPSDFLLFPEFKSALKTMPFSNVEDIESPVEKRNLHSCSGF
jgi:hypothetical protein